MAKQNAPKRTVTIPEPCRAGLAKLYADRQTATALYNTALSGALTALGLDPQEPNVINLDTGVVTLAAKPEKPGK